MLSLKPFSKISFAPHSEILLDADLQLISADCIEVLFKWQDKSKQIIFAEGPVAGRFHELWKQTCFEAFVQPVGDSKYFEINLNTHKAWNVYEFENYREPQPPVECAAADVIDVQIKEDFLRARIKFNKMEFKKLKVSLCAVLNLKETGTTYWSFQHVDAKPNFHHFGSFVIERNF